MGASGPGTPLRVSGASAALPAVNTPQELPDWTYELPFWSVLVCVGMAYRRRLGLRDARRDPDRRPRPRARPRAWPAGAGPGRCRAGPGRGPRRRPRRTRQPTARDRVTRSSSVVSVATASRVPRSSVQRCSAHSPPLRRPSSSAPRPKRPRRCEKTPRDEDAAGRRASGRGSRASQQGLHRALRTCRPSGRRPASRSHVRALPLATSWHTFLRTRWSTPPPGSPLAHRVRVRRSRLPAPTAGARH
jgi:hypothetical protein